MLITLKTAITYLHRFHSMMVEVMDWVIDIPGVWIPKTSYVDHIAVVKGNDDGKDSRCRMNLLEANTHHFV